MNAFLSIPANAAGNGQGSDKPLTKEELAQRKLDEDNGMNSWR